MLSLGIRVILTLVVIIIGMQLLSALWPVLLCGVVFWFLYRMVRGSRI